MAQLIPFDPSDQASEEDAEGELMPPFPGLTARQSAFVRCYVAHGDGNATRAAREAGYAESSAHAVGYRLLRHEGVVGAIRRETAMGIGLLAPIALKRMVHLVDNSRSDFVKQAAAADILDRAGFRPADLTANVSTATVNITIDLGE